MNHEKFLESRKYTKSKRRKNRKRNMKLMSLEFSSDTFTKSYLASRESLINQSKKNIEIDNSEGLKIAEDEKQKAKNMMKEEVEGFISNKY